MMIKNSTFTRSRAVEVVVWFLCARSFLNFICSLAIDNCECARRTSVILLLFLLSLPLSLATVRAHDSCNVSNTTHTPIINKPILTLIQYLLSLTLSLTLSAGWRSSIWWYHNALQFILFKYNRDYFTVDNGNVTKFFWS